jgi:AraC family transcriptional regulator of adaptative response/methylated-DNA-[protein]-cysteine methyltransferase
MLAIGSDYKIYLLEFINKIGLEDEIKKLKLLLKAIVVLGNNSIIASLKQELDSYFAGHLRQFTVGIQLLGTTFQQAAWGQLTLIPYGTTKSYKYQAAALDKPSAYRAVARANSYNKLSIIVPCHRIINHDGRLGGYSGGIENKAWLLQHEKTHSHY